MGSRWFSAAATGGIIAAAAFLPVSVAHAGEMTEGACTASVTSKGADGAILGVASFPGDGATATNPLPIDLDGSLDFTASSPLAYTSGTWAVSAAGIQVAAGNFTNSAADTNFQGTDISSTLPTAVSSSITGGSLVPVSVSVTAPEGGCTASGYVTGVSPASSSPVLYTGAALALVGTTLTGALLLTKVVI